MSVVARQTEMSITLYYIVKLSKHPKTVIKGIESRRVFF